MDVSSLNRRAERVSDIFNALAIVVAIIGGLTVVLLVISSFSSDVDTLTGLGFALAAAVYTVLAWAGVQLSSLVSGYIYAKTTSGQGQ